MGTKYTSVSISGYNASPPADDGSTAASNQVTWVKHKTKLGDPLKTAVEAMNSAIVTALDSSARTITSDDSTVAGDNGKTIVIGSTATPAVTVSLMDAATAGAGYIVTVVNESANQCTVSRDTASNTISSQTSDYSLDSFSSATFIVRESLAGYSVKADSRSNAVTTTGAQTISGVKTFSSQINLTSGQIAFPATQIPSSNANTLDDYEEGTWTPVLSDGTNNATMSDQDGRYTKVGRSVSIVCAAGTSALGSVSGSVRITGLPFTPPTGMDWAIQCGRAQNLAVTAGQSVCGYIPNNNSFFSLLLWDSVVGTTAMQGTEWSDDGSASFSGTYFTD